MFESGVSRRCALLAVAFVLFSCPRAANAAPPTLPIAKPNATWDPLYGTMDTALRDELRGVVNDHGAWRLLALKKMLAIGVIDLTHPETPRFAAINGNTMMYAASLPKIAILLAAFQGFEDGTLEDTPEVRQELNDMIRVSSNPCATAMIDRIGLDRIRSVVTDPRYRLYDEKRGGGLWVGKPYGRSDDRRGDPIHDLSHGATVTQVCRFYYLVATGRAVSRERSKEMLDVLADPGLHHKFVNAFDKAAPNAKLYRKSGTFRKWHSDSCIVWGDRWRRYILVALVESENGEQILRELVPAVDRILRPEVIAGS
jgi:beta-lactamase class A